MAAKRRGGPPTYTPTAQSARTAGQLVLRLAPQEAAAWREWAEKHGGLVALARYLLALHAAGRLP